MRFVAQKRADEKTLLDFLADVCKEIRGPLAKAGEFEARGGSVAYNARVERTTVYRFEKAEGWPHKLDNLIAVYAVLGEREQPAIWEEAIDRWKKYLATTSHVPVDAPPALPDALNHDLEGSRTTRGTPRRSRRARGPGGRPASEE